MRRAALLLMFIAWVGATIAYGVHAALRDGDKALLEVESEVIEFGSIAAGLEAEKVVRLTNRGTKEVVIRSVKTGCGCTDVTLDRNRIAPGETALLRIAMRSDGMRDQTVMICLVSNDAEAPVKTLRATANRASDDFVEPRVIDFGTVDRESIVGESVAASQSFMLFFGKTYGAADIATSLQVEASEPFIRVDASRPCTEDGKPITVSLTENAPTGDIDSYVILTDARRKLHMKMSVIGRVRGDVFALPQIVLFSAVTRDGGVVRRDVVVKTRIGASVGKERLQIVQLEISDALAGFVQATPDPVPLDGTARFFLLVDPEQCHGAWSTRVVEGNVRAVCRGDSGYEEKVIVPVRVSFRGDKIREK
jgi:hypothetical protein